MICKLNPVCLEITSNGEFVSQPVCLCLWFYSSLSVFTFKKQKVKIRQNLNSSAQIHKITKSDFELNYFIFIVSKLFIKPHIKYEYQKLNVKPRVVKMSVNYTIRNQHRKHIHLHIHLSKCRSNHCIIFCTAAINIRHVNSMMCLTINILQFPKEFLNIISVLCNKINVGEVCVHPLSELLYRHTFYLHPMNALIMCENILVNMCLINIIFKRPNLDFVCLFVLHATRINNFDLSSNF